MSVHKLSLDRSLGLLWLCLTGMAGAAEPDFQSRHLAVGLSRTNPAFAVFAVDALGQGKLSDNPVLPTSAPSGGLFFERRGPRTFAYVARPAYGKAVAAWEVVCGEKTIEPLPCSIRRHDQLDLGRHGERYQSLDFR